MAPEWHCNINGATVGPVNVQELKRLAEAGELKPTDLVKKSGAVNWVPASAVGGLVFATPQKRRKKKSKAGAAATGISWTVLPHTVEDAIRDYDIAWGKRPGIASESEIAAERPLSVKGLSDAATDMAISMIFGTRTGAINNLRRQTTEKPDPYLLETQEEREKRHRLEAQDRLESYGYPIDELFDKDLTTIIQALRNEKYGVLKKLLAPENPTAVRCGAISALQALQSKCSKTIAWLTPYLNDPQETVRYRVVHAMTSLGDSSANAIPLITQALLQGFPPILDLKKCAALLFTYADVDFGLLGPMLALGVKGSSLPQSRDESFQFQVIRGLIQALESDDPLQRKAALWQMERLDEKGECCLTKLRRIAANDQEPVDVRDLADAAIKKIEAAVREQKQIATAITVQEAASKAARMSMWEWSMVGLGGLLLLIGTLVFSHALDARNRIPGGDAGGWPPGGGWALVLMISGFALMGVGILRHVKI